MLVFLDTNIYIATRYIFDRQKFAVLRTLMEKGKVNVLYTSVTEGEVLYHIKEHIGEAVRVYNRVLKKEAVYLLEHDSFGISKIDAKNAITSVESKFRDFLNLDSVHIISLNPIDAEELMADYFNQNPPFVSKKPYEFKDAIIINALRRFRVSIDQDICIVSNDEGFRKAFDGDDCFITFERIGDFLHYYQKQEEYDISFEEFVSKAVLDGEFECDIREYLENLDISRGYYGDWECEGHHIGDIECELSFIDIAKECAIAYIDATVDVIAEIRHRDEDGSYYDREEGKYLFEKYVTAVEKHRINVEITIKCDISEDEDGKELTGFELVEDDRYPILDLDDETMIDYEETDPGDELDSDDMDH